MINTDHPATKTIRLDKPLEFGGAVIADRLELYEPTLGQFKNCVNVKGMEWAQKMIFQQTAYPMAALDSLPVRKVKEALEFFDGFFAEPNAEDAQTTGG